MGDTFAYCVTIFQLSINSSFFIFNFPCNFLLNICNLLKYCIYFYCQIVFLLLRPDKEANAHIKIHKPWKMPIGGVLGKEQLRVAREEGKTGEILMRV